MELLCFLCSELEQFERGIPRLLINYKSFNKVIKWINYPIPNKRDLLNRLDNAVIFFKLDMKSGLWQIQIAEQDRQKIAFIQFQLDIMNEM